MPETEAVQGKGKTFPQEGGCFIADCFSRHTVIKALNTEEAWPDI